MKELYLNAEMELVEFSAMDIIVTSPEVVETEATTMQTAPTGENEGEAGTGWS